MDKHLKTTRRHDIDVLRVLAFGILIFYHVGMFYVAEWEWHVKSQYTSEWLQHLMRFFNRWRMPLLFVVSGIAASFLLRKLAAGRFAASRTRRLLLPLAFGMTVIVLPQAYYEALYRGAIEPGYGRFLWHYFRLEPWPEGAFAGSDYGITWMHLWYLPYLLFYSLLLVPLAAWLRTGGRAMHQAALGLRGSRLVLLPVLPLVLFGWTLFPYFGGISHDFITDWYAHALFFTFFAYGYLLGAAPEAWAEIRRMRWLTMTLGAAAWAMLQVPAEALPIRLQAVAGLIEVPLIMLSRWAWILAILGWCYSLLNRPFRWLGYANEAVYPCYILHQTITVWIGYHVTDYALGPVVEPVVVLGVTALGCILLHEFLIRRSRLLRPLFGLKPIAATPSLDARPERI